ncbi:MAG TPA: hypothetical protein VFG52_03935 [Xanthomonadales bacterium]|nr:hypothetical protein [Xanthomonadales bacterium]
MKRNLASTTQLVAILLAFSLGAAHDASAADKVLLNGWTIEAGKIKAETTRGRPPTRLVKGSFELKSDGASGDSRRAGACLLADLVDQGVGLPSCTSHQQCNDSYKAAPNSKLGSGNPGPYLYCLGDKPGDTEKRCWIRPGPDSTHCVKNQFAPGEYAVPATGTVDADPLGKGKPVAWRVFACLNPDNNLPPACANTDSPAKVNSLGKAKKVSP